MADIYVLASPAPVLSVYPSALHAGVIEPPTPTYPTGPIWEPTRPRRRPVDNDDTALAILGAL